MPIDKDFNRQYELSAHVPFTYDDFESGVAQEAVKLPAGAIVTGGELVITTAFNAATSDTLTVGDGNTADLYATGVEGQAAARTALTLTGYAYTEGDTVDVTLTSVGTPTQGAGYLVVKYIKPGRGQEVQD